MGYLGDGEESLFSRDFNNEKRIYLLVPLG